MTGVKERTARQLRGTNRVRLNFHCKFHSTDYVMPLPGFFSPLQPLSLPSSFSLFLFRFLGRSVTVDDGTRRDTVSLRQDERGGWYLRGENDEAFAG